MHFRWDSGVARDISSELDWLAEDLDDCNAGIERCATILREMAGNDSDGLIEKYISLIGELKKGMAKLEENFSATSRGINRANELIDGNEQVLKRQAENMTAGSAAAQENDDPGWSGTAPLFYNIPGKASSMPPVGMEEPRRNTSWMPLEGIRQAVVIEQITPGAIVRPPWLQVIIENDQEQQRYH